MAVTYGFFNSVNGDRKYDADQMTEFFRGIVNEGVFQHLDGGLAVTAGTGLAVSVAAGRAIIQNRWVQNSAALSLSIAAASETYGRKDAVVIRYNISARSVSITVKTGTPAASPAAPALTRNSTTYEMALAYVNVSAGATSVTVTDKRSDTTVCGWATVAQQTSGEVDAQLNAMKTGFDGVVYDSPALMVRGCDTKLQTEIENNSGMKLLVPDGTGYIKTSDPTVDVTAIVSTSSYYHYVRNCSVGDYFTITSHSGSNPRSWAFIDSTGANLSKESSNVFIENAVVCAPPNAAKIVINQLVTDGPCYIGRYTQKQVEDMQKQIDDLSKIREPNLFVIADADLNKRLSDTGALLDYGGAFVSDYMSVSAAQKYYKNSPVEDIYHRICYYDSGKNRIGTAATTNITEAPANAKYVKIGGLVNEMSKTAFYMISAIDTVARAYVFDVEENGVKLDSVTSNDPNVTLPGSFEDHGVSVDPATGDIPFNVSSGNKYFLYYTDKTKVVDNTVIVSFDLVRTSGKYGVMFYGVKNDGTIYHITPFYTEESGHYDVSFDLNYEVVYNDLDLSESLRFGIVNSTVPAVATVKNFKLITPKYRFDTSIPFYETVNNMYDLVESNSNAIKGISKNEYLRASNGNKFILAVNNDGSLYTIPVIPGHTLFIGNSLLNGNGTFGLCASDSSHDYYHYVTTQITSKNPDATFDKMSGGAFEGCVTVADAQNWMNNTLASHLDNDTNLVIVQLGDNVNTSEKQETFKTTCGLLIQFIKTNAPNARIAWVGAWYTNSDKQKIMADACADNDAIFVDISTIRSPETQSYIGAVINYGVSATRNYNIDSYQDDAVNHQLTIDFTVNGTSYESVVPYTSYTYSENVISITGTYGFIVSSGASSHPGDSGMLQIANLINEKVGIS